MVSLFNKQALSASSVLDKVSDDRRYDLGLLLMISSAKLVAVVTGTKLHWCRHIKVKQKLEHGHSFQSGPVFAFFNQTTTTTKMSPSTSKAGGRCQSQNQSATGDNNNKSPTVHHHHHHQPTIPTAKNAERERSRVRSLRTAFQSLQACLPSVPPDTKLSKLDILILATNYIAQLMATLGDGHQPAQEEVSELGTDQSFPVVAIPPPPSCSSSSLQSTYYHPMKKWPMRSRLYSLVQLIATDKEIMGSSSSSASKMEVSTSEESSDFNNNNNESSSMIYPELHHHHHHQADFTCSDDMTSLFPLDLDDEAMMIRCAEGGGGSGSDC